MQFLLLIYDQEKRWTKLGEAEQNSEHQAYGAFGKELSGGGERHGKSHQHRSQNSLRAPWID